LRTTGNDRIAVTRAVAALQCALSIASASLFLALGSGAAAYAGCACSLAVAVLAAFRARSAIGLIRRIDEASDALEEIGGGNYTMRLRAGDAPDLDGLLLRVNRLVELLETDRAKTIRSESARKSLLSDISHDIRTPLTSIIGYIGALKDDIASNGAERDSYVDILDAKSRALKAMIDDIFRLAKLDADEIPMNPERIDLAETVREVLIDFLPALSASEIRLETDIPDTPVPVTVDRLSLERVAGNLVQNAIKHGCESRFVRVSVREEDRRAIFAVADRGRGISPADIPRVFDRLFSRDRARGSSSSGSGLGLAIVQALVSKNGGTVRATSDPGGETVFEVSFPAAASRPVNLKKN
jgi:signal transduction histidine kinase